MKPDERIARDYLILNGHDAPIYEPDGGSTTPDFLVDGRIAIEVRRLNQHEVLESGYRGLEETEYPLKARVLKVLAAMGPPRDGVSWFVNYGFHRPIPSWKEIKPPLRRALTAFADSPQTGTIETQICRGLQINFVEASDPHPQMFLLGMYSDWDAGGWVLSEMLKNIQICVDDKSTQLMALRSKYQECWLVLVDHVAYGLSGSDIRELRSSLHLESGWDKIIVIDPQEPSRSFTL